MKLPYPGYTWTINQHNGPASNVEVIVPLLKAAFYFSDSPNYRDLITEKLINDDILTPNYREDQNKPQAWRDYQQVLPELGLIYSTKYNSGVQLTSMGLILIDGYMSYKDVVASQVLKMQYPNGFKQDISPSQKKILSNNGFHIPNSLTELQALNSVQIKPAILILRILLKFLSEGKKHIITREEIAKYLLPISQQADWFLAYDGIVSQKPSSAQIASYVKRHIAEWLRLLSLSWMFDVNSTGIAISDVGIHNYDELLEACEYHENINSFWIPNFDLDKNQIANSWFNHFGSSSIDSQFMVDDTVFEEDSRVDEFYDYKPEMNLKNFEEPDYKYSNNVDKELSKLEMENRRKGKVLLQDKTRLHDLIVTEIATIVKNDGYEVFEDRNSADLIAVKNDDHILFEVKTVTKKNLKKHLRLGNAQLLEYRYRMSLNSLTPKTALVLSGKYEHPKWMVDFFDSHMNHSLIGRTNPMNYIHHTIQNRVAPME